MFNSKTKKGNILLAANYEPDVGYAWWLMENYWVEIARHFGAYDRTCFLIYQRIKKIQHRIEESGIRVLQHYFSDHSVVALLRIRRLIVDNNITSMYLSDRPYRRWYNPTLTYLKNQTRFGQYHELTAAELKHGPIWTL